MEERTKYSTKQYWLGPNSIFSDNDKLYSLVRDYESGVSWKELEAKYNVSHGTIYNALRVAGVIKKGQYRLSVNKETVIEIVEKYKKGMTISQISQEYDISDSIVRKILEREKIIIRKYEGNRKVTDKMLNDIVEAYNNGMSWREMVKKFQISGATITRALKRAGIKAGVRKNRVIHVSQYDELIAMYKSGAKWNVMRKKFRVSTDILQNTLRDLNVKVDIGNRRRIDQETLENMINAYNSGDTWQSIEKKYGIPISTARSALKRAGIQFNTRRT